MTNSMPRIVRGTTYLVVPKGKLVFPAEGPGSYQQTIKAVRENGLETTATGAQIASLMDEVYNSQDASFKESFESKSIRQTMKGAWFWVPNRVLWTPRSAKNAGVYVQHDSKGVGLSEILNVNELEETLSDGRTEKGVRFSKDGKTAFAPYNTVTLEEQNVDVLAQNGFVIASYGIEGAEQLAKVSKNFAQKPYVWGVVNNENKSVQGVSALGRYWLSFDGLDVSGSGGDWEGYAFGVCKTIENK